MSGLAIDGSSPVRETFLPYGRHLISKKDIQAIKKVLTSAFLTQGPESEAFEIDFARRVNAPFAVALSSGTAALHAAVSMLDLSPGDEVIVPSITFAATANAVVYCGGKPVFADVDPLTGLLNLQDVESQITRRTKAVIPVHYAGHPCDMKSLRALCRKRKLKVIVDAAHALGTEAGGSIVGSEETLCTFSTHPVKHITTGEGGVVTTTSRKLYERLKQFRTHGIHASQAMKNRTGEWFYEMTDLGFNYRLTDIGCTLGRSQLKRLDQILQARRNLAKKYFQMLEGLEYIKAVRPAPDSKSAFHIFPALLQLEQFRKPKKQIFAAMRAENIGVQVHYIPVYHHPYYKKRFGYTKGLRQGAERFYLQEITLPLFPGMKKRDQLDTIEALQKIFRHYRK